LTETSYREVNMSALLFFTRFLLIQIAVAAALASVVLAQQSGTSRPASPSETRRMINEDTFREMMRVDRETIITAPAKSDAGRAAQLQQLRDDFKTIQNVNNRMMAEAWAREQLEYGHISGMISEINERATRLKTNLSLPEPDHSKRKEQPLSIASFKEFRSALLLMDRSLMSFVRNPIFQRPNVVEIELAKQARLDLEYVIALSGSLKKHTASLKNH
jgi:hypothetical protein